MENCLASCRALNKFVKVPKGLHNSFRIGLDSFCFKKTFISSNHYKSSEVHNLIISKYSKEIKLGQVSPEFIPKQAELLFGPICTAPLNVIISVEDKQHVMLDLSYPCNDPGIASINSMIDFSFFQCDWGTFVNCWLLVADSFSDMQVTIFDVESAFCIVSTCPCDWPFLTVSINSLIYFDFRLNFGTACSLGIFNHVANTIIQIFLHAGINAVLKWVDNFIFFYYPLQDYAPLCYSYNESLIWSTADYFGWPWAPDKFSHS